MRFSSRRLSIGPTMGYAGLLMLLVFLVAGTAQAQEFSEYKMPPKVIADLIDAPTTPQVSIDPTHTWILIMKWPGLPSIEEVAQPELRLAGLRINPRTNGPSRGWYYNALVLQRLTDGFQLEITGLPDNPKIDDLAWSPDASWIAFTLTFGDRVELWGANTADGIARRLSPVHLNGAYRSVFQWVSDNKTIVALTVPADRGAPPPEPLVPTGPTIQENIGRATPAPTFQDLLQNKHDEDLFDYYVTSQPVVITIDGDTKPIGSPTIYRDVTPSPNGAYLLAETIHRPYSYTVPLYRFPRKLDVWDFNGNLIHKACDKPLADQIPIAFGSVPTGPREHGWRQDAAATLFWVEAQDGGDAGADAEARDKLFIQEAPFTSAPVPLMTLKTVRFDEVMWGSDNLAIATGWWWTTRNIQAWRIYPGSPQTEPELLIDRSWEDRYNDPGTPLMVRNKLGQQVLLTADNGKNLFLTSPGASDEGDRPFLDKYNLKTKKSTRLFRSEAPYYENPVYILDPDKGVIITRREAIEEPPNYYIRDLKKKSLTPITTFPNPTPQLAGVSKELIRYERDDGVQLTGTLYLPTGYNPETDGPRPVLMWAYPTEFKSADAAGQMTDSPYRFVRVGWYSPMLWLTMGYVVLDDPSMPIVGEGDEEPNDTFIKQLVASAQAAVDELVRRGVGDRDRMAIGGHSYGAFMTANLLAHSDLFRTGLARSGAYNRTLTPFGFQSEERTYWQAPEVYYTMSPFMHADKIDEPILLIHGEADNNPGTFPLQSERFYDALKGLGATVRLVMLPHESHSYRARESVMHVLWETTAWLEVYVRAAQPRSETSPTE